MKLHREFEVILKLGALFVIIKFGSSMPMPKTHRKDLITINIQLQPNSLTVANNIFKLSVLP
jgi:hypothetical protein